MHMLQQANLQQSLESLTFALLEVGFASGLLEAWQCDKQQMPTSGQDAAHLHTQFGSNVDKSLKHLHKFSWIGCAMKDPCDASLHVW